MSRKFSLAYLTIPGTAPVDQIRIAKEAGYDFVSLRTIPMHLPGEPEFLLHKDAKLFEETRQALKEYDMPVMDIELARVRPDLDINEYDPAFEKAAELGATDVLGSIWTRDKAYYIDQMAKIAETYQPGKVSIEGHAKWEKKVDAPAIIIEVAISATTEATAVQTAANSLLGMNPVAIFCSNEGAVTGFLAAVSDGEDLAEGGKYAGLVVAGFDAGAAQKNAVRQGWFYGSVTQDPYQIGYKAVELAVKAANGEAVEDVDTGAQWYDASNIDDEMIALLVYD